MQARSWKSAQNWWTHSYQSKPNFKHVWSTIIQKYANQCAYFQGRKACSYLQVEDAAQYYRQIFSDQKIIRISGIDIDWLTQAIAAWTENKIIIFFDPNWEKTDLNRYQSIMSEPANINWQNNPHSIILTSGSTGKPKFVTRSTELAIYEAASYIDDILPEHFNQSICFIKPWFGAITKHCLGMLFAGIPQYFSPSSVKSVDSKTLAYGTPSLIKQYTLNLKLSWGAISLTGEKINAHHIQFFKQCLDPSGFILDSYGLTECGVIARRKIFYHQMEELLGPFYGELLVGKKVFINDAGLVSVQVFNQTPISTGDLGWSDEDKLFIKGRVSSQRKIHGIWVDTSPLTHILSMHPMIHHVQLSSEETKSGHLIVNVSAEATLSKTELYFWILKHSIPMQLIPHINLTYERPTLGVTGKQNILIQNEEEEVDFDYISVLSEWIVYLSSDGPNVNQLMNQSLEELGLDSLDIVNLTLNLQKNTQITQRCQSL